MIRDYFHSYIQDLKATLDELDPSTLERIIEVLMDARRDDKQIFIIGNGGSASTASHFACDLGKGTVDYGDPEFKRFRAMSLTDNMAFITAVGNDISYDEIFSEQLRNYLNPGDVVLAITGSGNSPNVLRGIEFAKGKGATTIGFLGFGGGKAKPMVDIAMVVSSRNYGISEDFHLIIEHIMTQIMRRMMEGHREKVAFLDRDGVINEKPAPHQYVTRWQDFSFRPGAIDMLQNLQSQGYRLAVITNQQGVGKSLMTAESLQDIHARMKSELAEQGVTIDGVFACTHLEQEGCSCRKPQPGLFHRAMNELNYEVDRDASVFIGDSSSDRDAAAAFGVRWLHIDQVEDSLAA